MGLVVDILLDKWFNLVALTICASGVLILKYLGKFKPSSTSLENTNAKVEYYFKPPVPEPYPNWSIGDTKPLPYRPFKHNYFVTMGIRSMDWNEWLELDKEWPKFHNAKLQRLSSSSAHELYHSGEPTSIEFAAAVELLESLIEYLPNRYPSLFEKTAIGLKNLHTSEEFDIVSRPWKQNPIVVCSKLLQDDFAIMIEGRDGQYYLRAGSILLAGFWRLKDKLNMPLSEIHSSGDVPQFREKLQASMDRFFTRMRVDKPVLRNNYFIQTDDNLAWSYAIGPEDSDRFGWYTANELKDPDSLYFRSERQSLRRLPKTRAIIFTIRTYFIPLSKLMAEPYVPKRLYDGIINWSPDVAEYKGLDKFKGVLFPYLSEHHQKQLDGGLIEADEVLNYPF